VAQFASRTRAGDTVKLTLMRRDRLGGMSVTLAAPPADTAWIEVAADATADAKTILDSWSPP